MGKSALWKIWKKSFLKIMKNKYENILADITKTVNTTVLDSTWTSEKCLARAKYYFDKIDITHTKNKTLATIEEVICFLILAEDLIIKDDTSGAF